MMINEDSFLTHCVQKGLIEIGPERCSGRPVLFGTRFTISQIFAELADKHPYTEIADDFDLDENLIKEILIELSSALN